MNITLLKKIEGARQAILATILRTEGHTYKKIGEKALYEVNDPLPVWGNFGAGCVDQQILMQGNEAFDKGKPRVVRIETNDPSDVVFGYGSYCGGVIEVLLETVTDDQKAVYRELMDCLEKTEYSPWVKPFYLTHDLESGVIALSCEHPRVEENVFTEPILPPLNLYLFGATPLAHQVVRFLEEVDFRIHVIDWRASYLEKFKGIDRVRRHKEFEAFDGSSLILVLSHHFERDRDILKRVLIKECAYIGLLTSWTRRGKMFEELSREGIPESMLERVSSPVGIDIGAKSDPEIAVSIVAELIQFKNHFLGPAFRGLRGP